MSSSKNNKKLSWEQRNPERSRAYKKEWKKQNRDKLKVYYLRHKAKYPEKFEVKNFKSKIAGLKISFTLEEYRAMNDEQREVCAICGEKDQNRMLSIDHCHETLKVRGLLCKRCNSALGFFRDDIKIVANAVVYLKKNGK